MHVLLATWTALALAAEPERAPPPGEPVPAVAAAPATDPADAAEEREAPDLHPRFVGTVADLAPLASDPVVRGRVESLDGRRRVAVLSFVGAGIGSMIGSALALYEMSPAAAIADQACWTSDPRCHRSNYTSALVAFGISAALGATGALLLPRRHDVADVARLWNARHPEDPVETWPAAVEPAPAAVAIDGDVAGR